MSRSSTAINYLREEYNFPRTQQINVLSNLRCRTSSIHKPGTSFINVENANFTSSATWRRDGHEGHSAGNFTNSLLSVTIIHLVLFLIVCFATRDDTIENLLESEPLRLIFKFNSCYCPSQPNLKNFQLLKLFLKTIGKLGRGVPSFSPCEII